ncbi:UNVERIFIED_CONTAM: hypothetical protein PYX00_006124 [Menopon gallinae]|uniref:Uncharacterized protein n=1 Tax=Menopon gallinae TaxID=328185 RepID=A0AAW2HUA9_9NEOP
MSKAWNRFPVPETLSEKNVGELHIMRDTGTKQHFAKLPVKPSHLPSAADTESSGHKGFPIPNTTKKLGRFMEIINFYAVSVSHAAGMHGASNVLIDGKSKEGRRIGRALTQDRYYHGENRSFRFTLVPRLNFIFRPKSTKKG